MLPLSYIYISLSQLDSSDEQAAAIRRELDARRDKVAEMERVGAITNLIITLNKLTNLSEPETDAKICPERHGRPLY